MVAFLGIRRLASRALAGCTFTARRGLIKGMRVRGGMAFLPEGVWPRWHETAETRFLTGLDLSGKVIYDIGALHGHLTMFFAQRARYVVAYEPNPMSVKRIAHNLSLNGIENVKLCNAAVGDFAGSLELAVDPDRPALSTGDPIIAGRGSRSQRPVIVPVVRLDGEISDRDLPPPDMVKVDVEGMEIAVLRGMERTLRRVQPQVYVEVHGVDVAQKMANAKGVIEQLLAAGYEQILHIETGRAVGVAHADEAREGHLWAEVRTDPRG